MIEMAPLTQHCPERTAAEPSVHVLAPGERLHLTAGMHGPCEDELIVADGVLYVVLDEDEVALMPGDAVVVRVGELRCAWNAGDDVARVIATRRARSH
jgi:mannose-6-phosphate isomerase-like protein (cupin superfamily)